MYQCCIKKREALSLGVVELRASPHLDDFLHAPCVYHLCLWMSLNLALPEGCLVSLFVPVSAVPVCAYLFLSVCVCKCCYCLSLTLFIEQHREHHMEKEWDILQRSFTESYMGLSLWLQLIPSHCHRWTQNNASCLGHLDFKMLYESSYYFPNTIFSIWGQNREGRQIIHKMFERYFLSPPPMVLETSHAILEPFSGLFFQTLGHLWGSFGMPQQRTNLQCL